MAGGRLEQLLGVTATGGRPRHDSMLKGGGTWARIAPRHELEVKDDVPFPLSQASEAGRQEAAAGQDRRGTTRRK